MAGTTGCDIVYDRRAYVLGVDVNDGVYVHNERQQSEHNSGISFLVTRKEYLEGALSQAQQDHERQQRIQRDVHGENQNTHEQIKVKVHPKPFEPTKEERQSHEATVFPVPGVKSSLKPRALTENTPNSLENAEHILVIEFDYAFATDTPGDPNRKISMMVATGGSIFDVVAGTQGGQDDYVMQSFQNYIGSAGIGQGRVEVWPRAKHSRCGKHLDQTMSIHDFDGACNSKKDRKGVWDVENDQIWQLRDSFEHFVKISMRYETEIGPDHVLMGWMVRHCAWVVN